MEQVRAVFILTVTIRFSTGALSVSKQWRAFVRKQRHVILFKASKLCTQLKAALVLVMEQE